MIHRTLRPRGPSGAAKALSEPRDSRRIPADTSASAAKCIGKISARNESRLRLRAGMRKTLARDAPPRPARRRARAPTRKRDGRHRLSHSRDSRDESRCSVRDRGGRRRALRPDRQSSMIGKGNVSGGQEKPSASWCEGGGYKLPLPILSILEEGQGPNSPGRYPDLRP